MKDTVYSPSRRKNLISVSRLESIGFKVLLGDGKVKILMNGNLVQSGNRFDGLYYIEDFMDINRMDCMVTEHNSVVRNIDGNNNCSESYLWHVHLGHNQRSELKG